MALEASAPTPYIPNTAADRARMLERIGLPDTAALFAELPAQWRDPPIEVPPALSELELVQLLRRQAAANRASTLPSFLGAGAYRRYIPAVTAHLVSRAEFVTAYTPYQPEISQGGLQVMFEYQTAISELTGLPVSNASVYDGASAAAESVAMCTDRKRKKAIISAV